MPYIAPTVQPTTAPPPPEQDYVEITPPATEADALFGPVEASPPAQQESPITEADALFGSVDGTTPPATPAPNNDRLGPLVDPLMAQAPEPVKNLANIVGQPVGGALDAAGAIGGELLQGDLPGAAEAVLQVAGAPQMRVREAGGERVAQGRPVELGPEDMPQSGILSPVLDAIGSTAVGQAVGNVLTAPIPGTDAIPPPPTAVGGALAGPDPGQALAGLASPTLGPLGIEDWWGTLSPEDQDALAAAGGNAVVDAFLIAQDAAPIPPPQLSNPLDAGAVDANPIQRGLNILGAVPESIGGWMEAGREGALGPFLKNQLIESAMDPLVLVPPAVGERAMGAVGRAAGRIPGMERATTLTDQAQRTITGEQIATGAEEVMTARAIAQTDPGAAPVAPLTPEAVPPPPNGRQPSPADPGQASAAAPPIIPRDAQGRPPMGYDQGRPVFRDEFMARERSRIAAPEPERPPTEPIRVATERVTIDADITERVRRGEITNQEAVNLQKERHRTTPPSPDALELRGSRWIDVQGRPLVAGQKRAAHIAPEFVPQIERVYGEMMDAPAERFYESFPADWRQVDVPAGDVGMYARYRAAMTQGLYMLDDWPAERTASYLRDVPGVVDQTGRVNWNLVEELVSTGDTEPTRYYAKKAVAGKRALDLYTHRLMRAADPDLEATQLLIDFHLDQLSDQFKDWRADDWRYRAKMIGEAMRDAGYIPRRSALDAMRGIDLAAEARARFGEALPEDRLRLAQLAGKRLAERGDLVAHFGNERIFLTIAGEGLPDLPPVEVLDEAARVADEPPVSEIAATTPPPEPPPPTPEQAATPEAAARRQAANAAVAAAPEPVRQAVAEMPDPFFTRYGVAASEQAVKDLSQNADGMFRFADGYRPEAGLTVDDVLFETMHNVEFWANLERISEQAGGWSDAKTAQMNRRWQLLDKRFNPDGSIDRSLLAGPPGDLTRQAARDQFALRMFREAEARARPSNAPKTRIGAVNEAYLGFVRTSMLFNYLNLPRYVMQNMMTNSINMGARIGGKAVLDLWTSPADATRVFRANRAGGKGATFTTRWGSIEKQMGVGSKPNIAQSHVKYLAERGSAGKLSKGLDLLGRVIAPETLRYVGNVADQLFREKAAEAVVMREYRKFNRELVPKVMRELSSRNLRIPDAKVRQVVHDFLNENRRLTDANSGEPYRTFTGRPGLSESVWNPEAFGQYLKQHLTEDMRHKPDPGDLSRAIDRITRDSKTRARGILDEAERKVDEAFFSWRDTNADAMARKVFLYHYWSSRQGGLYLQEAIKRPWILSSYGRMMEEMQQQAEDLDQPNWMKGFFQIQNSVAGFSTWFSPFDLLQSLLTFADWQYGEDYAEYKDLTALGRAGSQAPFLIHPLLQLGAYWLGLMGPDYYSPPVTGAETFGANAINLLNLANAQGKLPAWVNEAGIGVDANGNKVPLPVRPLQELYARVGNAISSALAPITGLSPVEVANMAGSQERNIASILETEYRRAHPEADQMQVNAAVTELLADTGSAEYQAAFRKAADMPYHLMDGMNPLVSGAARLASPVRIYSWPEQYNLDRWNVSPSGYAPERNIPHLDETDPVTGELTPAGERAKHVYNTAKYGATTSIEGRQLSNMQNEYYALEPLDYAEANDLAGKLYAIYDGERDDTVTIGGVEYTPEMLRSLERGDLYDLGTQALADAGYTRDDQQSIKDAQARYLADNPELAGYFEYKDVVRAHPGGVEGFVQETAMVNPSFRQYVRSSMMNHLTGEIDYDKAQYVDAYLASQGVRPSVYSPVVGNEPSTIPGGYPALAGAPTGQPLLPPVTATEPFPLYSKPLDPNGYFANESLIAWIDPQLAGQMQTVSGPDPRYGMTQVSVGGQVGFVDPSYLASAAPPQPTAMPGPAPAPVHPQGGLAGLTGGVTSMLGAGKDAIVGALGNITGLTVSDEATLAPAGSAQPATYTADATGQEIVTLAEQYVGVPYVHEFPMAQDDPWQTGWDCSSFIKWLADTAGVSDNQYPNQPGYVGGGVPTGSHYQWEWALANDKVVGASWQDAQPGDAIYFATDPSKTTCNPENWNGCLNNEASHVGLYLGLDPMTGRPRMLHAAAPGIGTVYDYLDTYPYQTLGVVRWLPA